MGERFQCLCASYLRHDISNKQLILYFYEGLLVVERHMMDAISGGVIVRKMPRKARKLIPTMAANSRQFGLLQVIARKVNEIINFHN